jgi:hypothetical protein
VIEWAERWIIGIPNTKNQAATFPIRYRSVRIHLLNETARHIIYEDFGD